MGKQTSDFRYNTGATRVPWAAVGENYNVQDLMEIIRFLMQGEGKEYEDALEAVWQQVKKLDELATPPGKLSLGSKVEAAENACNEYLGTDTSTFVTNATAGFEIAYKYANLKAGDEVIVPAITFVATMAYPLAIGCKLVFADVDPKTINMDPKDVEKKIINFFITDDGCGFNNQTVKEINIEKSTKLGLKGMESRAILLNGTLQIQSDEETGTHIKLVVPVSQ